MHKYNRVFNVIAVFIFIGIFWVTTLFLTFSFTDKKVSLKQLLPENIEIVLSINADQLIKTLLFDALYKSEFDENDLKLLDRGKKPTEAKDYGVMFNSEIVVFYDLWNNIPIQGILFNISNKKDFERFKLKGKNQIKRSNGKQGLILILKEDASKELIHYAEQFADDVFTEKMTPEYEISKPEMLNVSYKGNEHTYIQNLNLNAKLQDEKILFNGIGKKNKSLDFTEGNYNMLFNTTNEKNLEIQSGHLPDSIYQYFKIIFDKIDLNVPVVTSQQMMIYGVTIENIDGSTALLPKFDWILRFDTLVNIDQQLGAIKESTDKMQIIDKQSIKVGGTQYYYKQISAHEIYIGVTEFPNIQTVKTKMLPFIKGNPSVLLEIEGKGIIAQFVNVMPMVKNTRTFMENIDYFDIHTLDKNADELIVDGEIRLKEDKMMSVELVKFILMFMK